MRALRLRTVGAQQHRHGGLLQPMQIVRQQPHEQDALEHLHTLLIARDASIATQPHMNAMCGSDMCDLPIGDRVEMKRMSGVQMTRYRIHGAINFTASGTDVHVVW